MLLQEFADERHDAFVSVFDHIVATVVEAVNFGVWPVLNEPLQARWPKTPVAHAPDELNGKLSERIEAGFNSLQHLPRWMSGSERDVAHETIDGDSAGPTVVRRQ